MANLRKTYTQEEVNNMTDRQAESLFERGIISDDMMQRRWDCQDDVSWLEYDFITNELPYLV